MEIYENTSLESLKGEVWVDAIGYEGFYKVSNLGRVKSLGRYVSNGKSKRWVKEKILKQSLSKDGRLSCGLSVGNTRKTLNISASVFYSFNPEIKNDYLNDEVFHINKKMNDNKLCNLSYNKQKGKSYSVSIKLGNVSHLKEARKQLHPYTKNNSVIVNGKITHRKCKKCNEVKLNKEFESCGRNTCNKCRSIQAKERYKRNKSKKVPT